MESINLLTRRGFLIDSKNDRYYLSDNSDPSDREYLNQILHSSKIGYVDKDGYTTNNEVFNFIDYSDKDPKYLDLIVSAIGFFNSIDKNSDQLDSALIKEAASYPYYHRTKHNEEAYYLHNLKDSILSQVRQLVSDDIRRIRIAVPYYDGELSAYKEIKDQFPNADVQLYIQNHKSTFPVA